MNSDKDNNLPDWRILKGILERYKFVVAEGNDILIGGTIRFTTATPGDKEETEMYLNTYKGSFHSSFKGNCTRATMIESSEDGFIIEVNNTSFIRYTGFNDPADLFKHKPYLDRNQVHLDALLLHFKNNDELFTIFEN